MVVYKIRVALVLYLFLLKFKDDDEYFIKSLFFCIIWNESSVGSSDSLVIN